MTEETAGAMAPRQLRELVNPGKWDDRYTCQRIADTIQRGDPDGLWTWGGRLAQLDARSGRVELLDQGALRVVINDHVHMIAERFDRYSGQQTRDTIPITARYMLPLLRRPAAFGFRELRGVRRCPFLSPSGRMVCSPGWDEETGIWLQWDGEPVTPDAMDADTVRGVVSDLLGDFSLRTTSDFQHALGLLLLCLLRPAVDGPTPFHLVGSTGAGVGKTLLASLPGLLLLGHEAQTLGLDDWGAEARRQLTAALATVPDLINLDNMRTGAVIGGPHLHHYLTARGEVSLRPVGQAAVSVPIRAIWLASANFATVDEEQARRTVPIVLERPPGFRARDFKHADLGRYIIDNRALVLSALAWIVEEWVRAGRPSHARRPLPSFGEWSRMVGGCVVHFCAGLGMPDHWLDPEHRPAPAAPEWDELSGVWPRNDAGLPVWVSSKQIAELLSQYDLGHFLDEVGSTSPRGMASKIGRLLLRVEDVGIEGHPDLEVLTRKGPRTREYILRRSGTADPEPSTPAPSEPVGQAVDVEQIEHEYRATLDRMSARGVRVDAEKWDRACRDYMRRYVTDEPDPEVASDRRRTFSAYAQDVGLQARRGSGRVRTTWRHGAWSGRLTSSAPPLQAITKTGDLRAAVTPAPGHRFVVADWCHSHLRIAAGRSGDEQLMQDLRPGRDPHQLLGDALAPALDAADRRRVGKLLGFAALNLCSPRRVVELLRDAGVEMSTPAAAAALDRHRARYPQLAAWIERWSVVSSWTTPLLGRSVEVPNDARGSYPSRVIANILQSIEADALRYVLAIHEQRLLQRFGARVVLIVHDEVVWEVPAAAAPAAAAAARRLMVEALSLVSGDCPILVDVDVRGSWA